MQPPGKRNVAGRSADMSSPMSARSPFSRPRNVRFGRSETCSRSNVPTRSDSSARQAFRSDRVGTSVAVCRRHVSAGSNRADASTSPFGDSSVARNGVSPRA